jgi:hypothetical protein
VVVPHNIDTEGVQSHRLQHQDAVLPVLIWDSTVMYLSGIDSLVINLLRNRIDLCGICGRCGRWLSEVGFVDIRLGIYRL